MGNGLAGPRPARGQLSVRWSRLITFSSGTYHFSVHADDGVRVWIDGTILIDQWHDAVTTVYTADRTLSQGGHTVLVEYYERQGAAQIQFWWDQVVTFSDWRGEYYATPDLTGSPVLIRNDPSINFTWGTGSPGSGIPSDNFSVRWTRSLYFDVNTYRFHLIIDDGARLWIDGQLLIDEWHDAAVREATGDFALTQGTHTIRVDYYERTGNATAQLWWEIAPAQTFTDWKGEYFANPDLSGAAALVRNDTSISFDWGAGSPGTNIPVDNYSARWTRQVNFTLGVYRFSAQADDGFRFYIDGSRYIDQWHDSGGDPVYTADVNLSGTHTLTVEYYDHINRAMVRFWWDQLPTPTPTASRTSTPSRTPSPSNTPLATPTNSRTATPTATATPSGTATRTATPTASSTPSSTPTITTTSTPTRTPAPPDDIARTTSPDGKWTALVNTAAGSLELRRSDGKTFPILPAGSTAQETTWSPDSRRLLVVETHWLGTQPGLGQAASGAIQIYQVRISGDQPSAAALLYQGPGDPRTRDIRSADQILFGSWSPNSRYVLFWMGPYSASIWADGVPLLALDADNGKSVRLAEAALANDRYQSWAQDSSAAAFVSGAGRSAMIGKSLDLYSVSTGQVSTIVSRTEQIPGIVAWSPRGNSIAYAAIGAAETNNDLANSSSFQNPAILKRRIYLVNPATRERTRLNQVDAFQDAPVWSADGGTLYYVQRDGNEMALVAAAPATGQPKAIDDSRRPAPQVVGFYGQSRWDDLLGYRPDVRRAPVPALAQTMTDQTVGYALKYPTGWQVGRGFRSGSYDCNTCITIEAPLENPEHDLTPFGGLASIVIQSVPLADGSLDSAVNTIVSTPGPGQSVGPSLTTFARTRLTADGRNAARVKTMDEIGVVNTVVVIPFGRQVLVLRAQGDSRVLDAIAASIDIR